jgi:GNAT superfamily N-acetyltransferase
MTRLNLPPVPAAEGLTPMLDVRICRHEDLPQARRDELAAAASNAFDRFPIVRQTTWAAPDWSVLGTLDTRLACFYNAIQRTVQFDGRDVRVVGLNNLVTLPDFKGRGLASRLLQDTERMWFETLGASHGLLLCADALVPFYERLGWRSVPSEVRFAQPGKPSQTWAANCMLLHPDRRHDSPGVIDLAGLPW